MPHPPPLPRRRADRPRRGYTVAELLITLVIAGIAMSLAATPLAKARNAYAVRAARQEMTATLEAARSAAVQRGSTSRFVVRGNAVLALVDTAAGAGQAIAGTYTVLAPQRFDRAYGVTLTPGVAADTLVAYDARGMASPRLGRIARVVLRKGAAKDSVCVSNLGQILRNGCTP